MARYDLKSEIVEMMKKNPKISILKMAFELDCHESTIQYYIDDLRAEGKVERVGGKNGGHWEARDGEA